MPGGPSIRVDADAALARKAAAEKRKADCLANASSFQSQCKTTYSSANTMCNTSNALLTGGAGKGLVTFAQWKNMITDRTISEISSLVSASSLASGYNTDFPFPCTSWNDQAIKACDTLASQKVSACPK